ncbi:DUF4279 domain-containing protein [Rhodanobacter sp. UC4436_H3]
MKNNVEIDFQLWATSIPPRRISELTKIQPDVQFLKGERNNKLVLPRENLWAIRSKVNSNSIEDHWNELEGILLNKKEALREVAGTGSAKLTIVVNSELRIPSIVIPPRMSAFAAFLEAFIEIDHIQT